MPAPRSAPTTHQATVPSPWHHVTLLHDSYSASLAAYATVLVGVPSEFVYFVDESGRRDANFPAIMKHHVRTPASVTA